MWKYSNLILDGENYICEAKVYDEGSQYGIDGGRVSKLRITHVRTGKDMVVYEREWIIPRPEDGTTAGKLLQTVLDMYKEGT